MARKVAVLVLSFTLVAVAVACGKADDRSGQVDAGAFDHPTAAFLSDSATKTAELDTGRYRVTMTSTGSTSPAGNLTLALSGAFDRTARRTESRFDAGQLFSSAAVGGDAKASAATAAMAKFFQGEQVTVTDGDTIYLQGGMLTMIYGATTPWVSMTAPSAAPGTTDATSVDGAVGSFGLDSLFGGSTMDGQNAFDSKDLLAYLEGISGDVTKVGGEQVDGAETTHYTATIDPAKIAAQLTPRLPADKAKRLQEQMDQMSGSFPIDVWIGGDGLLRRFTMTIDSAKVAKKDTSAGVVTLTFDLTDLNQPVDIAVPPADQVTKVDPSKSFGGLLSKLRSSVGH